MVHWWDGGLSGARFTHPDYAALVDPLFACGGKRVGNLFMARSEPHIKSQPKIERYEWRINYSKLVKTRRSFIYVELKMLR